MGPKKVDTQNILELEESLESQMSDRSPQGDVSSSIYK